MARGSHKGGYFRGGGQRQRLGGIGGVRVRGTSTMGRLAGDYDAGIPGIPGQYTDTPKRVGGRFRHFGDSGGFGGGGRRFRRSSRRR